MGRTKQLLEEDWERVWLTDYMYKMERLGLEAQQEIEEARIEVIDKRTKQPKPYEPTTKSDSELLPF